MNEIEIQSPEGYFAVEELVICSNRLTGGGVPIRVKDFVPLFVGKGEVPIIWLSATKDGIEWNEVVRANNSLNEEYKISFPDEKSVLIRFHNLVVLHAFIQAENAIEIDSLDLRPLGLDFHGNKKGLFLGTNAFAGNVFQGVAAMVKIG